MTTLDLMKKFNALLEREQKASTFLDNEAIPIEQRMKWVPEYRKVFGEMNGIFLMLEEQGYKMTEEEVNQGFRQVKFLDL